MHNIDYFPEVIGQLAFVGAEGCGKYAAGGRGGREYVVTSLEDDGSEGTLRYAVEAEGPRVVTFVWICRSTGR